MSRTIPARDKVVEAIREHGSQRAAARELGVSKDVVWSVFNRAYSDQVTALLEEGDVTLADNGRNPRVRDVEHDERLLALNEVRSFEELFDLYGIDSERWEVAPGSKIQVYDGKPNIMARLRLKHPAAVCLDEIIEEIREASQSTYTAPELPKPAHAGVTVLCLTDVHLGKQAEHESTGEEQTLELSRKWVMDTLERLCEGVGGATHEVIVPIGSDFLNTDNILGTTTKGTPQNNSASHLRTFRFARSLLVEMVSLLREHWGQVTLLTIGGNHDYFSSYALGEILDATFAHDDSVTVDVLPSGRKYLRRGSVCLCFAHGDKIRRSDLFSLFPHEANKAGVLAGAKICQAYTGDKHGKWYEEKHGTGVKTIRALCATDLWHYGKGYVGNSKGGEADVWAEDGSWCQTYEVRL